MKRFLVIIICISLIYSAHSQSLGLRANTEFTDNKEMNSAFGGGIYLDINDSFKRIDIIVSLDFINKEKDFPGMISSFHNLYYSVSPLYVFPAKEKMEIKIGPIFNYNTINANENYNPINIISTYMSKYVGIGLIADIQFKEICKLPLNFDIFISPSYLINIKYQSLNGNKSEYADNLQIFYLQVGLSYIIQ